MSDPDRFGGHLSVLPVSPKRSGRSHFVFFCFLFLLGGLMDRASDQHPASYLRRRSRERLGLRRSRLTSCRRAIHRLPTPRSLRCRRCNTGCGTGRPGHPARHRSSRSRRSKKLLPRNIHFVLKSPVCTQMSRISGHREIKEFRRLIFVHNDRKDIKTQEEKMNVAWEQLL